MQTDTPDRILRIRTVLERTGLSRRPMYRRMESGTSPGNVKIGSRCTGRHASALAEWLRNLMFYPVDDGFTGGPPVQVIHAGGSRRSPGSAVADRVARPRPATGEFGAIELAGLR